MHETQGASWNDFDTWLRFIESERARLHEATGMHVSAPLFRGHADASWKLRTTLERQYPNCTEVAEYYRRAYYAKESIEAHTGRTWTTMSITDYDEYVSKSRLHTLPEAPTIAYFVYLRHHGFPSPLLDWTQSPYVAAYFAFGPGSAQTDRVAIYAFVEHAGYGKGTSSDIPAIRSVGSFIRAHKRHFLQQSEYTFCVVRKEEDWHYASHESAIADNYREQQDLVWRFTLPMSERAAALRYLDKFNLNAFSLLGSEESLMETLAFRMLRESDA